MNEDNQMIQASDLAIKQGEKVRTFFKHPDFDARIGVYHRPDIGLLVFSFMSQGTSPDGTRRNPERRKAFVALLPQLVKELGYPRIVRYGSSKETAVCPVNELGWDYLKGIGADQLVTGLYRKGITYRFDMVFPCNSPLDVEIAVNVLDLVPTKNRPAKQADW